MKSLPYDSKTFTGKGHLSEHTRNRNYTQRFMEIDKLSINFFHPISKIPKKLREQPAFSPQNIIFVTDGYCMSGCAFLTKWVKQRKLGKVIGIGAVLDNPRSVEYDSGTGASGPVESLSDIMQTDKRTRSKYKLPQGFPRSGTDASFTTQIVYSAAQGEENVMNEFKIVPPDAVLRIFPNALKTNQREIMSELAPKVQKYFDQCFDWEVNASSTCTSPSTGTLIPHAEYGHPCKNGSFDTSKCVFRGCSHGYYLSSNGTACIVSPKYKYPRTASWFFTSWRLVLFILIICLLLAAVILLVVFCCYCIRNQKQTQADIEENGVYKELSSKA